MVDKANPESYLPRALEGAGAPGTEIEITPEMIEAGVNRLADLLEAGSDLSYAAVQVFVAMRQSSEN